MSDPSLPRQTETVRIGLVATSDRASQGVYKDEGIPALEQWLAAALLNPIEFEKRLIPDERAVIEATLKELVDERKCHLVVTTGGTGPAARDVTPEATLAVASFVVECVPHPLVAARLSAEFAIGVRHGCFCAHPYLVRLLGLSAEEMARYRENVRAHDKRSIPGAVRASGSLATTEDEIDRLLAAVGIIASGEPAPVEYEQDITTGDYWPSEASAPWATGDRALGASCARG